MDRKDYKGCGVVKIFGFPVLLDDEIPKDEIKMVVGDWSQWVTFTLRNVGKDAEHLDVIEDRKDKR